jgi:ATP-dependent Clp protease ATP-binding subunit ClpA
MEHQLVELTATLSEQAAFVLDVAHEEAKRLQNSHIAVEHLLLGLIRVEDGENSGLLRRLQWGRPQSTKTITQTIRTFSLSTRRIEEIIRRQNAGFARRFDKSAPLELSPDAKHALKLANDEAYWMDQATIDTGHLLLGILLQPKGAIVSRVLRIDPILVRQQLREQLPIESLKSSFIGRKGRKRSRYTPPARRALSIAQEEALELQHDMLGTEHLLLGLIRERAGLAGQVLENMGLYAHYVRPRLLQLTDIQPAPNAEIMGLSYAYKRVLDYASQESRARNHSLISTGHLLFHLLRFTDDPSVRALRRLNIKPQEVYKQMGHYVRVQSTFLEGVEGIDELFPDDWLVDFTMGTRTVFADALAESMRLDHRILDTGHLLMGLLLQEDGIVAEILQDYGVKRRRVRGLIELMTARDSRLAIFPMSLSTDLKDALKITFDVVHQSSYNAVDTPHLLLGLVSQTDTVAAKIFRQLRIDREALHQEILRRLIANLQPSL